MPFVEEPGEVSGAIGETVISLSSSFHTPLLRIPVIDVAYSGKIEDISVSDERGRSDAVNSHTLANEPISTAGADAESPKVISPSASNWNFGHVHPVIPGRTSSVRVHRRPSTLSGVFSCRPAASLAASPKKAAVPAVQTRPLQRSESAMSQESLLSNSTTDSSVLQNENAQIEHEQSDSTNSVSQSWLPGNGSLVHSITPLPDPHPSPDVSLPGVANQFDLLSESNLDLLKNQTRLEAQLSLLQVSIETAIKEKADAQFKLHHLEAHNRVISASLQSVSAAREEAVKELSNFKATSRAADQKFQLLSRDLQYKTNECSNQKTRLDSLQKSLEQLRKTTSEQEVVREEKDSIVKALKGKVSDQQMELEQLRQEKLKLVAEKHAPVRGNAVSVERDYLAEQLTSAKKEQQQLGEDLRRMVDQRLEDRLQQDALRRENNTLSQKIVDIQHSFLKEKTQFLKQLEKVEAEQRQREGERLRKSVADRENGGGATNGVKVMSEMEWKRFSALAARADVMEVELASSKTEAQDLRERLLTVESDRKDLSRRVVVAEKNLEERDASIEFLNRRLKSSSDRLAELTDKVAMLSESAFQLKISLVNLDRLQGDVKTLSYENSALKTTLSDLRGKTVNAEQQNQISVREIRQLKTSGHELTEKVSELSRILHETRTQLASALTSGSHLQASLESVTRDLGANQARLEETQQDLQLVRRQEEIWREHAVAWQSYSEQMAVKAPVSSVEIQTEKDDADDRIHALKQEEKQTYETTLRAVSDRYEQQLRELTEDTASRSASYESACLGLQAELEGSNQENDRLFHEADSLRLRLSELATTVAVLSDKHDSVTAQHMSDLSERDSVIAEKEKDLRVTGDHLTEQTAVWMEENSRLRSELTTSRAQLNAAVESSLANASQTEEAETLRKNVVVLVAERDARDRVLAEMTEAVTKHDTDWRSHVEEIRGMAEGERIRVTAELQKLAEEEKQILAAEISHLSRQLSALVEKERTPDVCQHCLELEAERSALAEQLSSHLAAYERQEASWKQHVHALETQLVEHAVQQAAPRADASITGPSVPKLQAELIALREKAHTSEKTVAGLLAERTALADEQSQITAEMTESVARHDSEWRSHLEEVQKLAEDERNQLMEEVTSLSARLSVLAEKENLPPAACQQCQQLEVERNYYATQLTNHETEHESQKTYWTEQARIQEYQFEQQAQKVQDLQRKLALPAQNHADHSPITDLSAELSSFQEKLQLSEKHTAVLLAERDAMFEEQNRATAEMTEAVAKHDSDWRSHVEEIQRLAEEEQDRRVVELQSVAEAARIRYTSEIADLSSKLSVLAGKENFVASGLCLQCQAREDQLNQLSSQLSQSKIQESDWKQHSQQLQLVQRSAPTDVSQNQTAPPGDVSSAEIENLREKLLVVEKERDNFAAELTSISAANTALSQTESQLNQFIQEAEARNTAKVTELTTELSTSRSVIESHIQSSQLMQEHLTTATAELATCQEKISQFNGLLEQQDAEWKIYCTNLNEISEIATNELTEQCQLKTADCTSLTEKIGLLETEKSEFEISLREKSGEVSRLEEALSTKTVELDSVVQQSEIISQNSASALAQQEKEWQDYCRDVTTTAEEERVRLVGLNTSLQQQVESFALKTQPPLEITTNIQEDRTRVLGGTSEANVPSREPSVLRLQTDNADLRQQVTLLTEKIKNLVFQNVSDVGLSSSGSGGSQTKESTEPREGSGYTGSTDKSALSGQRALDDFFAQQCGSVPSIFDDLLPRAGTVDFGYPVQRSFAPVASDRQRSPDFSNMHKEHSSTERDAIIQPIGPSHAQTPLVASSDLTVEDPSADRRSENGEPFLAPLTLSDVVAMKLEYEQRVVAFQREWEAYVTDQASAFEEEKRHLTEQLSALTNKLTTVTDSKRLLEGLVTGSAHHMEPVWDGETETRRGVSRSTSWDDFTGYSQDQGTPGDLHDAVPGTSEPLLDQIRQLQQTVEALRASSTSAECPTCETLLQQLESNDHRIGELQRQLATFEAHLPALGAIHQSEPVFHPPDNSAAAVVFEDSLDANLPDTAEDDDDQNWEEHVGTYAASSDSAQELLDLKEDRMRLQVEILAIQEECELLREKLALHNSSLVHCESAEFVYGSPDQTRHPDSAEDLDVRSNGPDDSLVGGGGGENWQIVRQNIGFVARSQIFHEQCAQTDFSEPPVGVSSPDPLLAPVVNTAELEASLQQWMAYSLDIQSQLTRQQILNAELRANFEVAGARVDADGAQEHKQKINAMGEEIEVLKTELTGGQARQSQFELQLTDLQIRLSESSSQVIELETIRSTLISEVHGLKSDWTQQTENDGQIQQNLQTSIASLQTQLQESISQVDMLNRRNSELIASINSQTTEADRKTIMDLTLAVEKEKGAVLALEQTRDQLQSYIRQVDTHISHQLDSLAKSEDSLAQKDLIIRQLNEEGNQMRSESNDARRSALEEIETLKVNLDTARSVSVGLSETMEELRAGKEEHSRQLTGARRKYDGLKEKYRAAQTLAETRKTELVELEVALLVAGRDLKNSEVALDQCQRKVALMEEEIRTLTAEVERRQSLHDSFRERVSHEATILDGEIQGLREHLQTRETEFQSLEHSMGDIKRKNEDLRLKVKATRRQLQNGGGSHLRSPKADNESEGGSGHVSLNGDSFSPSSTSVISKKLSSLTGIGSIKPSTSLKFCMDSLKSEIDDLKSQMDLHIQVVKSKSDRPS